MTAFNVVRFKVKAGKEEAFLKEHRDLTLFPGMRRFSMVNTGDRTFCLIGEWESMAKLAESRAAMIGKLDTVRGLLEDLGHGTGVTDPVSGDVVLETMRR